MKEQVKTPEKDFKDMEISNILARNSSNVHKHAQ